MMLKRRIWGKNHNTEKRYRKIKLFIFRELYKYQFLLQYCYSFRAVNGGLGGGPGVLNIHSRHSPKDTEMPSLNTVNTTLIKETIHLLLTCLTQTWLVSNCFFISYEIKLYYLKLMF